MMLHFTIARIDRRSNAEWRRQKSRVGQRESKRRDSTGGGQRTFREIVFTGSRDNSQLRSDNKEISATKRYWTSKNVLAPIKWWTSCRKLRINKCRLFSLFRRVFRSTRERKIFFVDFHSFLPSARPYDEFSIAPSFDHSGWNLYNRSS